MSLSQTELQLPSTGNSGLRCRLIHGLCATALGPVVSAIVQLGSVPVLLHAWGAPKYGDWLLLSAIPSYLTLSDLGFGDASGSDMSMRMATNDQGALETFQSSWVLVTLVSLLILFLISVSAWWMPWQQWLRLSGVSSPQAAAVIIVLSAYVVVAQQNGIAESGYRSDGHFATGTAGIMILRLVEAVAATTIAALGGSLLAVAFAYLVVRCVGTMCYVLLLRRLSPWVRYGIGHARLKAVRKMAAPAFGFMALPVGSALSLQGFILVIGAMLGPVAVVSFSTLRALSRLNFQLVVVVKNGVWPELSRAFGAGNISLARRLHRHACQASLALSIFGGLLLWLVGPFIYRLWIQHNVNFDVACFHVLLLVVVTNSLWDTSSVIPMSTNSHSYIAATYSGVSLLSLGLAWILVPRLGVVGAAMALLATDAFMTGLVLRTALSNVQDSLKKFAAALFAVPRFRRGLQPAPEA